ncbi:hypothetical protein NE590_16160 [Blautia obeum]|jgi:zinc transporter ZupT|uniref:hypothetical protein n=1 Tax=Blautia obeum TaxID=40520 RepID=UPI00210CBEC4|nr:hypothetical protein [Blautia obeum]MCQ4791356.1 hypothetical protein [Blautia obeum]
MQSKANRKIDYKKVLWCLAMMALGTAMFIIPAFAAVEAKSVMSNLISLMCSMFKFVGAAIFVWAIIQFILATKRSDADSKADAVQTAVCGIALMAVAAIVKNLGLDNTVIDTEKIDDTRLDGGK